MSSIVNRFIIVVCAVVSLTYSSDVITNANWSVSGGSSSFLFDMTGWPLAMAVDKSGNIYASSGRDLFVGGRSIRGIAKWDHHQWTEIVPGTDTAVSILAMVFDSAGNMYVGGDYVQKFDGVSWQKIGNEEIGYITGLAINNRGELFAGTMSQHQDLSYVCKWNDTAWVIIGEVPNGHVSGLACDSSGNLFVCGKFEFIGGTAFNNVAKWDGSTWSSLDGGCRGSNPYGYFFNWDVYSVKCIGNDVYFAGAFDSCGSKNIHAVARWDGSTWNNVGKGTASIVYQLATDKHGSLYASGCLSLQNEGPCKVMKLVNDEWMVLDSLDTLSTLNFIIDSSGTIFRLVEYFSQLVDGKWSLISNGEGFAGQIDAFAYDRLSGYLYAGGEFDAIGNKRINNIARWDGKSWSSLGDGLSSPVVSLAVGKDGTVYAGITTYSTRSSIISAWNGESWTEIAYSKKSNICTYKEPNNCTSNEVNALAFDSMGNLYAGGTFSSLNDIPARNIARWDGKTWNALGDGIDGNHVNALAIDKKGTIYAGGKFDKAGTDVCHNIARWDGTTWSSLGEGIKADLSLLATVNALVIDTNGNLYAGGQFNMAGGIEVQSIAKWNGVSWSGFGSGINNKTSYPYIYALSLDENGNIYAGGDFRVIDTLTVNSVARLNGTMWEPLGDGVKIDNDLNYTSIAIVYALQCNGNGMLYTGGNFNYAGGKISNGFAQCNLNGPLKLIPSKNKKNGNNVISRCNDGRVLVRSDDIMSIGYRIYSLSGRQLNHERKTIPAGQHVLQLNTKGLAKGAYIADIRAGDASLQYRFIVR